MAISFYCPTCQNFCSVGEGKAGEHARCQACDQKFIIPDDDGGQAIKLKAVRDTTPLPGFWKGVFCGTSGLLTVWGNVLGVVFVCAAMGFKFFVGQGNVQILVFYLPIGFITQIVSWGCVCWYLMGVIVAVFEGQDELPDIEIGFGFEFFGNVFKSVYLFVAAFFIPMLPFVLVSKLLLKAGIDNSFLTNWYVYCGVFFFPMTVLLITVARGLWMVFWPLNVIRPIVKHPIAYLFTAGIVILSAAVHMTVRNYYNVIDESNAVIAMHFTANLGAGILSIIAIRIVGLFGRHYKGDLPE